MKIPAKINNFNVYLGEASSATKVLGVTDEVTLPNIQLMSEAINLAGMGGEIDLPSPGQIKSVQIKVPFSNISAKMFELLQDDSKLIILRSAVEELDTADYKTSFKGMIVAFKGITKEVDFGSLKKGGYGNPSITKELIRYSVKFSDESNHAILFDKFQNTFEINGKELVTGLNDYI